MVAPCLLASILRISFMVISLPLGTFFIISSTSFGAGITTVPVPHLLLIFSVIFSTLGRSLLSANFSCHDLGVLVFLLIIFASTLSFFRPLTLVFFLNFSSIPSLAAKLLRNPLRILDLVLISSDSILSAFVLCLALLNDVSRSVVGSRVAATQ